MAFSAFGEKFDMQNPSHFIHFAFQVPRFFFLGGGGRLISSFLLYVDYSLLRQCSVAYDSIKMFKRSTNVSLINCIVQKRSETNFVHVTASPSGYMLCCTYIFYKHCTILHLLTVLYIADYTVIIDDCITLLELPSDWMQKPEFSP